MGAGGIISLKFLFECFVVFVFCFVGGGGGGGGGGVVFYLFFCLACLPRVRYRCHKVRHQKMMSLHQSSKKADFKGGLTCQSQGRMVHVKWHTYG